MTGDARVGIVGLGLMGFALSARLVEAKIPLVGFDIDPARVKDSEAGKAREDPDVRKLIRFKEQDVFKLDLSGASVVTLYLLPELNVKLIPQLRKLKPGSRIVSHSWDMRGVTPDDGFPIQVKMKDGYRRLVYRWTTPLRLEKAD